MITIKVFSQESDTSILEKTISNIYDIERVKYRSTVQAMDGGTTYLDNLDTVFFDFTNSNNSTPKYHMVIDESELIYDGKRHISTLVNEKAILIDDTPNANNPLILTLYGVKKFLTEMMRMKSSNQLKQIFKGDLQGPIPNLELNSGLFQLMMCLVNRTFFRSRKNLIFF